MRCMIIGSGEIKKADWLSNIVKEFKPDCLIAADGGYNHLASAGLKPDVLLGDFDSISEMPPEMEEIEILDFPKEKDFTDMQLAMEHALSIGADKIILAGATGSRFDHSLANVYLLRKLNDIGVEAEILDEHHRMFIIESKRAIKSSVGTLISLLPLDPTVSGVTLEGFKYPLNDAFIRMGDTVGISNVVVSGECTITVKKGILLGIIADDSL